MKQLLDGCHQYGWLITILLNLAMFAYFLGGINSNLSMLEQRVARIERTLDSQHR